MKRSRYLHVFLRGYDREEKLRENIYIRRLLAYSSIYLRHKKHASYLYNIMDYIRLTIN